VDPERAQFLFGTEEPGFDVDNEDELIAFFERELIGPNAGDDDLDDELVGSRAAVRAVVARQILGDEPPEVWRTVERLQEVGLGRAEIVNQMAFALMHVIQLVLHEGDEHDRDRYVSSLALLPLPPAAEVAAALETAVADEQGRSVAGAQGDVLRTLGRDDDALAEHIVDRVLDQRIEDGELKLLAPDRLVYPPPLTERIVLTHRVNESEKELGALSWVGSDLAGFAWYDELSTADGDDIAAFSFEYGHVGWQGPDGWLDDIAVGDLIGVRVEDGVVRIDRLQAEPAIDDQLIARVRRLYDAEVEESPLPLLCEDLVFALLVEDPTTFDRPQPPLSELCERAGLELRGALLGHDESVWQEDRRARRFARVHDAFDDDHDRAHDVLDLVDLADDPDATNEDLRHALSHLLDTDVCWGVIDELVDVDRVDEQDVALARDYAERLVRAADTPTEEMMAHFVAGVVDERGGDVLLADAQFDRALAADPDWGPAVDRAAWYASDRGDARRAANLWRTLELPDNAEVRAVESMARRVAVKRGRNDPCWCGSGRKLKVCHGDAPEPIPLPDRVPWLASKADGYVVRRGGEAALDLFDLALARGVDPDDHENVTSLIGDPIVLDVTLTEMGWFVSFLRDRGPLLPDDERQLAAGWLDVNRTVYDLEEVRPGDGMAVRDVRTGEQFDVREPTQRVHVQPGQLVCGRAVPDSVTRQFVGAVFAVAPDRVDEVLALCDAKDAHGLCRYAAGL
jgi:SEC-C motif